MKRKKDILIVELKPEFFDNVSICGIDGEIYIKKLNNSKIQKFIRKIGFNIAKESIFKLDNHSEIVVKSINGQNNIKDIAEILEKEYPETANQQLDRLVTFMYILEKKQIIKLL